MAEEQIKKETFTTCPYTGKENAWVEQELSNGNWRGDSSANGAVVLADSLEGLRLRYGKLTLARLMSEESTEPLDNK